MRRLRILLTVLALSLPFALPAAAQTRAPQPCTCYCSTPNGAIAQQNPELPDQCKDSCARQGETVATCAGTADQSPEFNPFCYGQSECSSQTDPKTGQAVARWDENFQPPECLPGKHYCYPISRSNIQLSFKLGNVSTVSDLGDYIGIAYNVLLGVATTIAIVMLMLGGFQYVLGAGSPEQLAKGKSRMKNAAIGLVLLFGAYVILFTVNPQLVKLEAPALRMTKGIAFISNTADCQKLKDSGCILKQDTATKGKYAAGFCGSVAQVDSCPNGQVIAPGTTCQFYRCNGTGVDAEATAVCVGQGDNASCIACTTVGDFSNEGFKPSESSCSLLTLAPTSVSQRNYCWYSGDRDAIGTIDATVGAGSCAELRIDCQTDVHTCSSYDGLTVRSEDDTTLGEIEPGEGLSTNAGIAKLGGTVDRVNIETICNEDPCGSSRAGTDGTDKCIYDDQQNKCLTTTQFRNRSF